MMSAEPPSKLDIISERYVLSQALLAATASVARCAEPDAVLRGPSAVLSLPQAPRIKLAWMRLGELDADILHPEYAVGSAAVYAGGVQNSRRPERGECPGGSGDRALGERGGRYRPGALPRSGSHRQLEYRGREDYFGRWGGEQFICVLPYTPPEDAMLLAERMRTNINNSPGTVSSGILNVSASFGVSSFP